jgi:hypothetical protein
MIQKGCQPQGSAMPVEISCTNFAEMGHCDVRPYKEKEESL